MAPDGITTNVMSEGAIFLMTRAALLNPHMSEFHRLPGVKIVTVFTVAVEVLRIESIGGWRVTRFTIRRRVGIFAINVTVITIYISVFSPKRINIMVDIFAEKGYRNSVAQLFLRPDDL
jgi:hypothetical protein